MSKHHRLLPHRKAPGKSLSGCLVQNDFSSSMRAATSAAATTAAAAAAGLGDVFGSWHMAEFKSHADVFADLLLQALKFLLGGKEVAGHLVFKKSLACGFELADFSSTEFHAGVLLVVKFLTALVDALVLKAGGIVAQKAFDALLQLEKMRVAGDLGAQFPGFHDDSGIFGSNGHVR